MTEWSRGENEIIFNKRRVGARGGTKAFRSTTGRIILLYLMLRPEMKRSEGIVNKTKWPSFDEQSLHSFIASDKR